MNVKPKSAGESTNTNHEADIVNYNLPPLICSWFKKKGVSRLFDWQVECLNKNDVQTGGNLVYSAPTSAGKTLVADFLLLKRVLEYGKKALVIEPFVALTREKAASLKSMLFTTKARVGAFGGNYFVPGGFSAVTVAVCTIEKANNIINRLINEDKLSELGIIVVDEIHYLGDPSRGYLLELLLTKTLYHNSTQDRHRKIQIVGLSATVPNLQSIAIWLNASLYTTDYRPVPLIEKIKIGKMIYKVQDYIKNRSCQPVEIIDDSKIKPAKDFDDLCYLCIESIVDGHSALVFCESKRECEIMATNLSDQIKLLGSNIMKESDQSVIYERLRGNISTPKIFDTLNKLKKCPIGIDKDLHRALSYGVAFHHAGLTSEEREIIEDGFKGGAIKVLMATSTLSSGVNLPARRVIIKSPTMFSSSSTGFQREMLNPSTYKQMIGRAGRKNIDTCGESILICNSENQNIAMKLIRSSLGDIESSLAQRLLNEEGQPAGLKKAILEVIANGTANTRQQLDQYLKSTFWLSYTTKKEEDEFLEAIKSTLTYLLQKRFIEQLKPGVYRSTRLGSAVLASGLHPDDSLELVYDLTKARQGFCLLNDLHIIYQVTPNDIARTVELNWLEFHQVWTGLDDVDRSVGELVGVDENIVLLRCQGRNKTLGEEKERIYRRFWVALVVNDLINEVSLPVICKKYGMTKAKIQKVQGGVAQFAGVMSIFCQELGYKNIAALVTPLELRINSSCQSDLLDLIKLNITRPVARSLHSAGYTDMITLAHADKLDVEFALRQIKPFKKDSSFNQASDPSPSIWVPELVQTMTTLDYAAHIVESAKNFFKITLNIELQPNCTKRSLDADQHASTSNNSNNEQVPKRERRDNESEKSATCNRDIDQPRGVTDINANLEENQEGRDVSNFVVHHVGSNLEDVDNFLLKWTEETSISINFKLVSRVSGKMGKKQRIMASSTHHKRDSDARSRSDDSDDDDDVTRNLTSSQLEYKNGLKLKVDTENQEHVISRLYVCFGSDTTVHVIDEKRALQHIRDKLSDLLNESQTSEEAHNSVTIRTKLYTQDVIRTYKVLHAAFGLSKVLLTKYFEWHSFEVAWWLVNDCPNRGFNNTNSSLSLVSKTRWAANYHHFLYPDKQASRMSGDMSPFTNNDPSRRSLKIKDIVKSGKTAILKPLIDELLSELETRGQMRAYSQSEVKSRLSMADMIINGMGLNMRSLKKETELYDELAKELTNVAQKHYAKSTMSLTSLKDVAKVLYKDLDLKKYLLEHSTLADISKDPTRAEVLNILSAYHPFPKLVQDFRKIGKALDALQSVNTQAQFNSDLNMMRVFGKCDFWQLTGRVAMHDPDLFLINRNFTITIPAHANKPSEDIDCAPRRSFVPCSNWTYVAADYSQLELRLLAHFSKDKNLLDILNRSKCSDNERIHDNDGDQPQQSFDVFKTVASRIYQKPIDEISAENRQHAKQICYGIIYGMGNTSLANQLGVDHAKAEEFRQYFFNAFPSIETFAQQLLEKTNETGYVESLLGRRRIVNGLRSENSSVRSRAERVTINTRIQSSASDIIKLAIMAVDQKLLERFQANARMVLEMHDELIFEVSSDVVNEFSKMLKFEMENLAITEDLQVQLLVNLKKGANWADLEDFKPD